MRAVFEVPVSATGWSALSVAAMMEQKCQLKYASDCMHSTAPGGSDVGACGFTKSSKWL